jgi:hypothetical protein
MIRHVSLFALLSAAAIAFVPAQYNPQPPQQAAPAVAPIPAQQPVAPQIGGQPAVDTPQQARLMARRVAIADAQRQLGEMVFGVRLDSYTTVRDFVTQQDVINTNIVACIRGAEVVDTRYLPDGVVEVDMELPVIRLQHVIGRRFAYPSDVFRVTGMGVPNAVKQSQQARQPVTPPVPYDYSVLIVQATGTGAVPPAHAGTGRGYALAKRAAMADGYRNLGENVMGVRIDSETIVRDFVTESDQIQTRFNSFIKGAKVSEVRELPDGIVEVDMELALDQLGNILLLPSKPTPRYGASQSAPTAIPAPNTDALPTYNEAQSDHGRNPGYSTQQAPPTSNPTTPSY